MTGRELIIYILENNLEDEVFFERGRIPGFMSVEEAAVEYGVGVATIKVWHRLGVKPGIVIGDVLYFPKEHSERGNGDE